MDGCNIVTFSLKRFWEIKYRLRFEPVSYHVLTITDFGGHMYMLHNAKLIYKKVIIIYNHHRI